MCDEKTYRDHLLAIGLADRTVHRYGRIVMAAERWCEVRRLDLLVLSATEVRQLSGSWPDSEASRRQLRAALSHWWEHFGRFDGPTRAIRVPTKPRGQCRALEPEDVVLLGKVIRRRGDDQALAVAFGIYAGLRRSEIATIRWCDIGEGGLRILGKGNRIRHIPMHPTLAEMLVKKPTFGEYLFPGRFGGPCNPNTIWHWVRCVTDEAGLGKVAVHRTRHTALASINDATGDLRTTQEIAGHAKPETTAIYTRTTQQRMRAAIDSLTY